MTDLLSGGYLPGVYCPILAVFATPFFELPQLFFYSLTFTTEANGGAVTVDTAEVPFANEECKTSLFIA